MLVIDTTIISVFVSAAVALLILLLKEYYLEPKRKKRNDAYFNRQLISVWISDMKSNIELLKNQKHRLDRLVYDDRPLDRIALYNPVLAKEMTNIRCRIREFNKLLDVYDATLAPQLPYILMPDPLKEPYPPQQRKSGELDTSQRIKQWQKDWLDLINTRRDELLPLIENSITLLRKSFEEYC